MAFSRMQLHVCALKGMAVDSVGPPMECVGRARTSVAQACSLKLEAITLWFHRVFRDRCGELE